MCCMLPLGGLTRLQMHLQGLTVQLRPYQRQSLHFMLDAEEGEGGFRRHLWLKLHNTSGQSFWYSPVLRLMALDVPALPWGGFLAEEVWLAD